MNPRHPPVSSLLPSCSRLPWKPSYSEDPRSRRLTPSPTTATQVTAARCRCGFAWPRPCEWVSFAGQLCLSWSSLEGFVCPSRRARPLRGDFVGAVCWGFPPGPHQDRRGCPWPGGSGGGPWGQAAWVSPALGKTLNQWEPQLLHVCGGDGNGFYLLRF